MKLFAAPLILVLLPSCVLLEENPTMAEPSRRNLAGLYEVSRVSLLTPHKKDVEAVSIDLKNNGSFRLADSGGVLIDPPSPDLVGTWTVVPTFGLDLGSNPSWGVQLATNNKSRITAYCLGEDETYSLLIDAACMNDSRPGSYFIMKKRKTGPHY